MNPIGQEEQNRKRVQAVLESGKKVIIGGWQSRWHSVFTRDLPKRKVTFFEQDAMMIHPGDVGIILCTQYVSHADTERLKSRVGEGTVIRTGLTSGEIKRILKSCRHLLTVPKHLRNGKHELEGMSAASNTENSNHAAETSSSQVGDTPDTKADGGSKVSSATPEPEATPAEIEFVRLFMVEARGHWDTCVSRNTVSNMIRKTHSEDVRHLKPYVELGLIEGVIPEGGKRIGAYKAGLRMLEIIMAFDINHDPSSTPQSSVRRVRTSMAADVKSNETAKETLEPAIQPAQTESPKLMPLQKAVELISNEDKLTDRRNSLQIEFDEISIRQNSIMVELDGIDKELKRIDRAKVLIQELENI